MEYYLYSDISCYLKYKIFGFHYIIVDGNKKMVAMGNGAKRITPILLRGWLEKYPVNLAVTRFYNESPNDSILHNLIILSDCDNVLKKYPKVSRRVDRDDPFYVICHHAARAKALNKIKSQLEKQ